LDPSNWTCPVCGDEPKALPSTPAYVYPPLPSGNHPARLSEARTLGWNWGGFFIPYLWLVGHGRLGAGLFLMLSLGIPFAGFLHVFLYPAAALYLGFNGYELAWKHQPYHSVEQLREREREWTMWGIFLAVLTFLLVGFGLLYMRVIFEQAMQGIEDLGW